MKINYKYFLLLIFILIVGCSPKFVPTGPDKFPFELMVNSIDLGDRFKFWSSDFPEINNAFSYSVSYQNRSDKTGAFVTHQVSIYNNSVQAQEAFPTWVKEWSNEYWRTPENSEYVPNNQNDLYRLECLDITINSLPTKTCQLLQVHNNLIILVLTNINSTNISFSAFEEILNKLDERLPDSEIPMPE